MEQRLYSAQWATDTKTDFKGTEHPMADAFGENQQIGGK